MTKLISGRVHKVPSANVSAERYQFLEIAEAEPDLGLPLELGQIFTSDLDGNRYWVRLDTANVIETTNQYFTNVRVLQAVDPKLTTANVLELTNLYFTNTRVIDALVGTNVSLNNLIVSGDLEVQGNVVTLNVVSISVEDKNILLANGAVDSAAADGAGITIAGANAEITYVNSGDKFSINKNLNVQGNVEIDGTFIGNGLIIRNIVVSDEILTGNILGQGFTSNTIVVSETLTANVITANIITATEWNGIYTSNVIESPTNLYYTNDRVYSFVTGMSIGDLVDVANLYTYETANAVIGIQQGQALVWDGNIFIPVFVNSEVANVADLAVKVLNLENQSTANVREASSNLYFTNTRVLDAISLANIFPETVTANILTVSDIIATNITIGKNVIINDILANTGSITQLTVAQLSVTTNLVVYGDVTTYGANDLVVSDHLIYINEGSNTAANPDIGIVWAFDPDSNSYQHGGIFRDATDGVIKFFENYRLEPDANLFLDIDNVSSGFELANIQASALIGNVVGVVSSLDNHTTDALGEGTTNLYFTNARVIPPVLPLLTTANVTELDNLYFTNARVLANVELMSINVLADVDITGVAVNSALVWDGTKFIPGSTEAAIRANFANTAGSANVALLADLANLVSSLSNHDTSNLAEGTNLYYTNSRVLSSLVYANVLVADLTAAGNLVANGLIVRGIYVNDDILTGNINVTNVIGANVVSANIVSAKEWQGLYTANVIESPTNLYFTNARSRSAFTPGKGISITAGGIITNTGAPYEYNTGIDGSGYGNVLSEMATLVTMPISPADDRFLLRSIHITNVSDSDTSISGNILYATGNTAVFANMLPVPAGGVVELLRYSQLLQPGDKVNLQGFDSAGVATANLLQAVYTYETFTGDITYNGIGKTLNVSNTDILVYDSGSTFSIVESIKFVNLVDSVVPVKLYWADANNIIKAYMAHNMPLPPNSTVELITTPKRINTGDRLFARYTNADTNSVSVFVSARNGYVYSLTDYTPNVNQAGTVSVAFSSSETDGTLLFYTIE